MSCRRCAYQHGVVSGLCGDCLRWDQDFTLDELRALSRALHGGADRTTTALRLQILGALTDARPVSETSADSRPR